MQKMNINEMKTALYKKMVAEQNAYISWLKSQPVDYILNCAYECAVRDDIILAIENMLLSDEQVDMLLKSDSPLKDIYNYFENSETEYMNVIRDSINEYLGGTSNE